MLDELVGLLPELCKVVEKKLSCGEEEAWRLVNNFATPVTKEEADDFNQLCVAERTVSYNKRELMDPRNSSFTGPGLGSLFNLGAGSVLAWAPKNLVGGDIVAPPGPEGRLNTSVASVLGFSAAAGGAKAGSEVLKMATFGPGADLSVVRGVLEKGPKWLDLCPENDGRGKDEGCGIPPSPELMRACAGETADLLTHPLSTAWRFLIPRGKGPCAFVESLFKDDGLIGPESNVKVSSVDVTAVLEKPLLSATRRRPGDSPVRYILVILTWTTLKIRALRLLILGHYHPGWLTGQLGMQAAPLHMSPTDFVLEYRLPLWWDLVALPSALLNRIKTTPKTLQWELDKENGFQAVIKKNSSSLGGEF